MKLPLAILCLALSATAASAGDGDAHARAFLDAHIRPWAEDPVIVEAIKAQNQRNTAITDADIQKLDQEWRAEVGAASQPVLDPVLKNPVADFLRARQADSGGAITEAFVMDNHGLNVAATDALSDYWQGDEDKFQKTYPLGADAVHISEVELDDSSQSYQQQISIPITDPASGQPIGALTVGVDAEKLM